MIFIMNYTPESSTSFNSNWQLSSLFPLQHSHTNVPININIDVTVIKQLLVMMSKTFKKLK